MSKSKIVKGCPRVTIIKDTVFYYTENQGRIQRQVWCGGLLGIWGHPQEIILKYTYKYVFFLFWVESFKPYIFKLLQQNNFTHFRNSVMGMY